LDAKLFKGVTTFTTPEDIEELEYDFGAGTYRGERRLVVYNRVNLVEGRHFGNATSRKIVRALLEHGIYLIEATTAPPTYQEFLDMVVVKRVNLSKEEITKLEMIRAYLCSKRSPTHREPGRKR